VSGLSGSLRRRVTSKPPRRVEELAAYPTFAGITTSMTNDPLVPILPIAVLLSARIARLSVGYHNAKVTGKHDGRKLCRGGT
jgi:hypothetical protein